jgi:hypothetical protein
VGIDEEEAEDVNLGDIEVCINVSMMINLKFEVIIVGLVVLIRKLLLKYQAI